MLRLELGRFSKSCGVTVVLSADSPYVEFRNYFSAKHCDRKTLGYKSLIGFHAK